MPKCIAEQTHSIIAYRAFDASVVLAAVVLEAVVLEAVRVFVSRAADHEQQTSHFPIGQHVAQQCFW
jgi:hypothetical protein